jgi:hypothetical protein
MLRRSKQGNVLIQGWFVFLFFIFIAYQIQLNHFYYFQALNSLSKAKVIMNQHIQVIEKLRLQTHVCEKQHLECFTQEFRSEQFHYLIKFHHESLDVIEINITNH